MKAEATDTACQEWDSQWKTEDGRRDWLRPESEAREIAQLLRDLGAADAMDLGCGIGRHSILLASLGFKVLAMDGSGAGIDFARSLTGEAGNNIEFVTGLMTDLPCEDQSFDYLLAWNVIYHGDQLIVEKSISEIYRVLRPGGIFHGTMLSKRNALFGQGRQIAPNTFVFEGELDKAHPHFYCSQAELATLLNPMELLRINDREHGTPGSYHLHFVAKRS